MELMLGRPEHCEGRLEREVRTYDLLDRLGLTYWRTDHEAIYTMEGAREIDACLEAVVCKNLFLCNKQRTLFILLMMPGDKKFRTAEFSKKAGTTRLEFAPEEKMREYLDLEPGSVSVMGLMNDHERQVKLYMDKDVLDGEFIGCHPCVNTSSLKLYLRDLMEKILPEIGHEPVIVELDDTRG